MGIMATKLSAYLANATDEQIEEIRRTVEEFSSTGAILKELIDSNEKEIEDRESAEWYNKGIHQVLEMPELYGLKKRSDIIKELETKTTKADCFDDVTQRLVESEYEQSPSNYELMEKINEIIRYINGKETEMI